MWPIRGYYFITDSRLSRSGNLNDVKDAISAGVRVVQYRCKDSDSGSMYKEALRLRGLCSGKALFIINDRVDIALAVEADGVHIGQTDLPCSIVSELLGHKKIIGVTVHNIQEAKTALKSGADYLGVAPIFATMTKSDAGAPIGLGLIKQIKRMSNVPIAAVGGINYDNAATVVRAGADCVCAISAVVSAQNVYACIKKFQRLF